MGSRRYCVAGTKGIVAMRPGEVGDMSETPKSDEWFRRRCQEMLCLDLSWILLSDEEAALRLEEIGLWALWERMKAKERQAMQETP